MNSTKRLFFLSAVFLASCIQLPGIERPPGLTLTLTEPADTTYTNGAVRIQLHVQGAIPEHVELLLDDQPLTKLEAPYQFEWDTRSTPEGSHQLRARAHLDGQELRSEAREVVVDRTPPRIAEQKPTPGAQDVWVRDPIEAIFSEPVKANTLTQDSVKLEVGAAEVATTLSLSSDGKRLTLTPVTRPTVPNSLQLLLSGAITDLAGNPLASPMGAWTWNLPLSFSAGTLSIPGETFPYAPHLLIDNENNPFVSWVERTQAPRDPFTIHTYHLAASEWTSTGHTLTAHITFENLTWHPHTAHLDSSNNPLIVWPQIDESSSIGAHHLTIKHWNNPNWKELANTSPTNPTIFDIEDNSGFAIRLDDKDVPTLVWTSANSNLRVWRRTNNTWLELAAALNTKPIIRPDHIQLHLDSTGKPYVAWTEGDILVRRWNGSAWEEQGNPIGNFPGDTTAQPESMLLDEVNRPILAWTETDIAVPSTQLMVSRLEGSAWQALGTPLDISTGYDAFISSVSLQKDNAGNLLIAWMSASPPPHQFVYQINLRRWNGNDWVELGASIPVAAYRYNPYEPRTMSFAIDRAGRPYLAWPGMLLGAPGEPGVQIHRYNY
ncbi:Ig-like domain-containing protein [Stigmatella erecta]|uniref:Ig-like domain-containing protein n=1 Tax=Stigmatella erecta TaxID=83460 RepID=A0A1I0IUK4_9BACT|nr:Ig-like domain-containing protein [Stigmatella erecta]SEU01030.1 Ig-like domain-containing protein [Stigmatella erecta]